MYFPKINTTNKKLNNRKTKMAILAVLVLILFNGVPVFADEISDINSQINAATSKINELKSQKRTLQGEIAYFDQQIYTAQLEINKTQAEITQINTQIDETQARIVSAEEDLKKQKEIMKEYLRTMYMDGQTTAIELIARSETFSDFVDQSEYLNTMQQHVQETADKIVELKKQLDAQKNELQVKKDKAVQLKNSQVYQQQQIANQKAVKDNILAVTKGNEANYQNLLSDLYQKRAELSARNNETVIGGSSGYPYAGSNPDGVDPWGFYNRQCTSYAAWKSAVSGPVSSSDLSDWGHNHVANGGDWGSLASAHGYNVSYTPSVGAIMSFPYSSYLYYGHVAIVESINGDGTVNISEYNWSVPLGFGRRNNVNSANYGAVFITK